MQIIWEGANSKMCIFSDITDKVLHMRNLQNIDKYKV